ncbi:MAG: toll/interleukin-1 receptor domain-containing protein [Nodosilinea sp.]
MADPPRIFICYAHADNDSPDLSKRWLDRLLKFLSPLERRGLLKAWSDQDIDLGSDWNQSIQTALEQAQAAVLLVSQDFMGSKYIYESEVPGLLKRAKDRGVVILPIILRPCAFDEPFYYRDETDQTQAFSLKSLQAPNSVTKPLNEMSEAEQDRVLLKVYERLKEIVTNPPSAKSADREQTYPVEAVTLLSHPSKKKMLSDDPQSRLQLSQRLAALPSPQFEQMLFALDLPKGLVAGASAPQGQRVASLLEWAEGPGGCGLTHLQALLDELINPR